ELQEQAKTPATPGSRAWTEKPVAVQAPSPEVAAAPAPYPGSAQGQARERRLSRQATPGAYVPTLRAYRPVQQA
ncbi:MAG TPA: hypothetical protein DIW53_02750, partial [Achromobacter sp.]|nr:hypothetical protein [Achromobacter sp.]